MFIMPSHSAMMPIRPMQIVDRRLGAVEQRQR